MCQLLIAFCNLLILQLPRLATVLVLLGFAIESSALTIGRPQGPTWIGKPLDMVIPLSLDASDSWDSLCLQADVVQGDTPMSDQRVTVALEPGSSPSNPRMRVRSTVAVDEPVVTVTVRAGCDMKSTRVFALLADVPTDITVPGVSSSGPQAQSNATQAPGRASSFGANESGTSSNQAAGRRSSSAGTNGRTRDANAAPAPRRAAPAPRRAAVAQAPTRPRPATPPAPRAAVAEPKREAAAGAPRLQLEALEPVAVAEAGLKTSPQLNLPAAGEDPARRAEAAAQWRAMTAAPEAAEREAQQRMQTLEATLTTLRQQTAQNQRTLLEMRSELAEARESRYRNPLVYALIVLLLLALIAIFMLWRLARRAAAPAWWGEAPAGKDGPLIRSNPRSMSFDDDADPDVDPSPGRRSANATTFGATPFAPLEPDEDSDFDEPLPHPARTPDGAPVRPVNTEELFDVQQQSDFFLSLGQHDQAIAVLREHIAANPGTSALAYLDLLRIFHSLGRHEDYASLAEEFERAFNADVPVFEKFSDTGKGLEHYRSALARIESQWPAPGTLALIEELVFRKPGAHEEAFDLAAYQELLLLYSVAKEVIDPDSAPPAPVTPHSFLDTYSHDQLPTVPASVEVQPSPETMKEGPVLPASIYGAIDEGMEHDTVLVPEAPVAAPGSARSAAPHLAPTGAEIDLAEFDKTAYETIAAPMETPRPEPTTDPNVIDFELFDPSTEAEIAPRPAKPIKR
jgi:tetratricopeptide (TPR) repeat protein